MKKNIKLIIVFFLIGYSANVMAQSKTETGILKLSKQVFKWEVEDKIDSLENIFHEKFIVVGGTGEIQNKENYLSRLRSGNFVHNSIDIEEDTATVVNNTATVVGKGKFTVTISGNKITLHLSYIEVFTRADDKDTWKVLAMHATVLQN